MEKKPNEHDDDRLAETEHTMAHGAAATDLPETEPTAAPFAKANTPEPPSQLETLPATANALDTWKRNHGAQWKEQP